jgi:hypothetical protein
MRAAARSVAAVLDERVGYRGAFGIDGVCTLDGFLPNELNTRATAGLSILAASLGEFPLDAAVRLITDRAIDVAPERLESLILEAADTNRIAGFGAPIPKEVEPQTIDLRFAGSEAEDASGSERDASVVIGPGANGSFVRMKFEPGRFPIGSSVAPFAVSALRYVDRRFEVGLPDLAPAPDLFAS